MSSVPTGLYQLPPSRERFYDIMADHALEKNDGIYEDELRKAVTHMTITIQRRIFAPGMNEDISSRDDVRSTVRNDVGKADKLDATVEQASTDEWNMESSRIEEGTPESIFRKVVKQFDSSKRIKLANSLSVQTP